MSVARLTEGSRLLAEAGSVNECARKLPTTTRSISAWRAGRLPSDEHQRAMLGVLGIPLGAWRIQAGAIALQQPAPLPPPTLPSDTPEAATEQQTAIERLRDQCARLALAREEPGLTPRAYLDLEALELRASTQLARLSSHRLSESDILASRHWVELCTRIVDALSGADLLGFAIMTDAIYANDDTHSSLVAQYERDYPIEIASCRAANAALDAARETRSGIKNPSAVSAAPSPKETNV